MVSLCKPPHFLYLNQKPYIPYFLNITNWLNYNWLSVNCPQLRMGVRLKSKSNPIVPLAQLILLPSISKKKKKTIKPQTLVKRFPLGWWCSMLLKKQQPTLGSHMSHTDINSHIIGVSESFRIFTVIVLQVCRIFVGQNKLAFKHFWFHRSKWAVWIGLKLNAWNKVNIFTHFILQHKIHQ